LGAGSGDKPYAHGNKELAGFDGLSESALQVSTIKGGVTKMADLQDGESVEIKGSARLPYVLKNVGGVYSCTCPARWPTGRHTGGMEDARRFSSSH
jgi:hypothetical protein